MLVNHLEALCPVFELEGTYCEIYVAKARAPMELGYRYRYKLRLGTLYLESTYYEYSNEFLLLGSDLDRIGISSYWLRDRKVQLDQEESPETFFDMCKILGRLLSRYASSEPKARTFQGGLNNPEKWSKTPDFPLSEVERASC